jgi:hypothetical protein
LPGLLLWGLLLLLPGLLSALGLLLLRLLLPGPLSALGLLLLRLRLALLSTLRLSRLSSLLGLRSAPLWGCGCALLALLRTCFVLFSF